MKEKEIAKNLLLGRTCHKCEHYGYSLECDLIKNMPEEETCHLWEFRIVPELDIRMSSYPVNVKARKLKVQWTKDEG